MIEIFRRLIDQDRLARKDPNVVRGLDRRERLRRVDVPVRRKRMDGTLMLLGVLNAILSAPLLHYPLLLAYVRHYHQAGRVCCRATGSYCSAFMLLIVLDNIWSLMHI